LVCGARFWLRCAGRLLLVLGRLLLLDGLLRLSRRRLVGHLLLTASYRLLIVHLLLCVLRYGLRCPVYGGRATGNS
jgi:hypothetical protein